MTSFTSNGFRKTSWHMHRPVQNVYLGILYVKPRRREKINATSMIEMHMRQYNVADLSRIDPDATKHHFYRVQHHAAGSPSCRVGPMPVSTTIVCGNSVPMGPTIAQTK